MVEAVLAVTVNLLYTVQTDVSVVTQHCAVVAVGGCVVATSGGVLLQGGQVVCHNLLSWGVSMHILM